MSALNATCENGNDGQASVVATGVGPFTYQWDDPLAQTTDTATNLSYGTYFVSVIDTSGCISIDSISVGFNNAAPLVDLGPDVEICADDYVLSVDTGFSYLWSTLETTAMITASSSGTYFVAVSNVTGCVTTDTIELTLNTPITITSVIDSADCSDPNGSIDVTVLTGGGDYTYNWSNSETTSSISGLASGMYMLTVTDSLGCGLEETFNVGQTGAPIVTLNITDAGCFGTNTGSAEASANGGNAPYSFDWSDGQSGSIISNIAGGVYDVTVTDNSGCVVITPFAVGSDPEIMIDIAATNPSCGDSNGILVATVTMAQGEVSYIWNDLNSTDSSFVDSLFADTYSVTVTDSAGCTASQSINLNDSGAAILILGSTDNSCSDENNGTAFVSAFGAGPFTYQWNDGLAQTNDTAVALASGTYAVSVVDTNGCLSVGNTTVGFFYSLPVVDLGPDVASCTGSEVILTPGGGFASYVWSTGASTPSISITSAQQYDVFVTDVNGCGNSDSINVTLATPPVVNLGPDTIVCSEDGTATFDLDAGAGFSNYTWSTSETTQTINVNTGGTYSVTVSNVPECSGSDEVIVVFDDCTRLDADDNDLRIPQLGLNIYPNPSLGEFVIETSGLPAGEYELTLMSMSGQLLVDQVLTVTNEVISKHNIDLRETDSGIYMIVIKDQSVRLDGRVIIQ